MHPGTYIVAEAGVNHNGSLDMAVELVDKAVEAGADAVKFQTFEASSLSSASAKLAEYQEGNAGGAENQLKMLKQLELKHEHHFVLAEQCNKGDIDFLSTPFDSPSLKFLVESLGMSRIKIPSGEITNAPFLLEIARTGRDVILSTGMSNLNEIETALGVLAFGYLGITENPSLKAFEDVFRSESGTAILKSKVTLLHCTTAYPTPFDQVNLRAMDTLRDTFGLKTGLSDHSDGIEVAIAAVARGAQLVEKHITLDKSLPGPDHRASLEPDELKRMVRGIRNVESALGDGRKAVSSAEKVNMAIARKSLVAARRIEAGEVYTTDNIAVKRPGDGVSPLQYWDRLGKTATRDYDRDELLDAVP